MLRLLQTIFGHDPLQAESAAVAERLGVAAADNKRAVDELSCILREGPRLRLVVEPARRANGQYRTAPH